MHNPRQRNEYRRYFDITRDDKMMLCCFVVIILQWEKINRHNKTQGAEKWFEHGNSCRLREPEKQFPGLDNTMYAQAAQKNDRQATIDHHLPISGKLAMHL